MAVLTALKSLFGYPATLGGKVVRVAYINGPASYTAGTPQLIYDAAIRSEDWVGGAVALSGNYFVFAQPKVSGPGVGSNAWGLRWFYLNSGVMTEYTGTALTTETVQFIIVGG